MTEPTWDDIRAKFAAIAEANEEEVTAMSSAMHIGMTITGMMEAVGAAAKALKDAGMEPEDGTIGTATAVTNKQTGVSYLISVAIADDDDIAQYSAMLATARDITEAGTDETKH
jgi:hypothetical protein